jgi:pimeloyl-ACP methyl ester carboxylesterase
VPTPAARPAAWSSEEGPLGRAPVVQVPRLPGEPACGPSQASPTEPTLGRSEPPPAPAYFGPGFPTFPDELWGFPVGGFGGLRFRGRLRHTPVVFVHGNQADAQNWLDVMLQFANDAGYTMQEMYALSYGGLENYWAGAPVAVAPTSLDLDYLRENPRALDNGGHGDANDDEVPDLCRFVEAVQDYTGSRQVDLVAHSLGVTIAREMMRQYPALAHDVVAFVGIAGANHGTTVCRGLENSYYGCNEIAPGSRWLARLNGPGGSRETYPPTHWMTVYDGSAGDPYFDPPLDEDSPRLRGADNVTFPGAYHNDLRVDPTEVDTYLAFLLRYGQAGPGADRAGPALAARILETMPDGLHGTLCGIPKLTGPLNGCRGQVAASGGWVPRRRGRTKVVTGQGGGTARAQGPSPTPPGAFERSTACARRSRVASIAAGWVRSTPRSLSTTGRRAVVPSKVSVTLVPPSAGSSS